MGNETRELALLHGVGQAVDRGPYRVWRVKDPGSALSADAQAEMLEMMEREALRQHGGDYDQRYWSKRHQYFHELTDWWVGDYKGRLAGWQGLSVWRSPDGPIMYFDTLYVKPAHRATGISSCLSVEPLTEATREERSVVYPVLRTENPHVYRMFRKVFGGAVYPRIGRRGGRKAAMALRISRFAAERMTPPSEVDPDTFVAPGAYSDLADLVTSAPDAVSGDPVARYFREHLDPGAGDALVAVAVPSRVGLLRLRLIDRAVRARIRAPDAEAETPAGVPMAEGTGA
jgi:GNAT superfamily N-acetyltransferase